MTTLNEALDLLRKNPVTYVNDLNKLLELADQLSIEARGSVTVLYSGRMLDGKTSTATVIQDMLQAGQDIRVIDKTDVADFIKSDDFKSIVAEKFNITIRELEDDAFSSANKTAAQSWLYEPERGPWAKASRRFAQATEGAVKVLAPFADATRTFVKVELPELLGLTSKVTSINDMPIAEVRAMSGSKGIGAVTECIRKQSLVQIFFSDLAKGNYAAYLGMNAETLTEAMRSPAKQAAWALYLEDLTPAERAAFKSLANDFGDITKSYGKKLGKALGPLAVLLGLGVASFEASAAEREGKHEEAKNIMAHWAADAAGSELVMLGATAIAGIAVAALGLPAAVGGTIVLGCALTGGYFGGDGAVQLYDLLQKRDDNGRYEILNKLDDLLFGKDSTVMTPLPGEGFLLNTTWSQAAIVANAKADIAWRYTLRELNPFVLSGIDYTRHNLDGSLDRYDPETSQGAMSDRYLEDRAAMLTWRLRYDAESKPYNEQYSTSEINGNWDFVDLKTGLTLAIDGNGLSLSDHQIVFGTQQDDLVIGSGIEDYLYGQGGNDRLIGDNGDDTLEGGEDADTLLGGPGFDTYHADAADTILDSDGQGKVYLNGSTQKLSFATRRKGETLYRDAAGNQYLWSGSTLTVNDTLIIDHFKNGNLSIYLDEEEDKDGGGNGGGGGGTGGNKASPLPYDPDKSRRRVDPLALDLDADGKISTIASTQSNAYFDFNNDNIAEKSGWIAPQDGLLVLDANGNGVVDGLSELFGTADEDGFAELTRHDLNADGKIDAEDPDYARLLVWQDANGDGISQRGELKSLTERDIIQIGLSTTPGQIEDADNLIGSTARYQQHLSVKPEAAETVNSPSTSTEERLIADVFFAVNFTLTDSNPNRPLGIPPQLDADIYPLPWLRGYGNVKDLHIAYQENPHPWRIAA